MFFIVTGPTLIDAAERPNIVVILVDDMGYGDPGCFNSNSKIPTPHIDSLARNGMRFTDAHAPGPLCHMSRYGLMTGQYPFRVNVKQWRQRPLINKDQMTIASLLKSQGYHTAMVGKWHLGFAENGYNHPLPGGPVDRGFDSYFGIRASTDIPPYFYIRDKSVVSPPSLQIAANNSDGWSRIQGAFWRAGGIAPDLKLPDVLPRFTDEAIQVVQQHVEERAEDPLMLYLAYPAPHTPWLPSRKFVGKSGAGMYGDFLMMVDAEIGRILSALDRTHLTDESLVIFSSDNGPCWYESDDVRFGHDSSGGFRGMKADAWEGGHRMPFVVRWPGIVDAGSQSSQLLCFTDLLATFADLLDVRLPLEAGPDSFSFLPALTGNTDSAVRIRRNFVMQAGSRPSMMMIRSDNWKLIRGLGSGGFSERVTKTVITTTSPKGQLYDLTLDPGEKNNVYAQNAEIVAELDRQLGGQILAGRSRSRTPTSPSN